MSFLPSHPPGWSVRRLKYVATWNDEVLSEDTDNFEELRYVEISDVSLVGGIEQATDVYFHEAPSRARRRVRSGDVLISTVRTYLKAIASVGRAEPNLIASTGFCVVRPGVGIDSGYLGWIAKSEPFVAEIVARSAGVSYPAIKPSELATLDVPLPPLDTQRRIARFLDEKTAKIDALIAKKRALLERLAEKRQALITQAITRGIDPRVPMKDSGIDWLGQIPAHWALVPFKWRCQVQSGQVDPTDPQFSQMPLVAPDHIENSTGRIGGVTSAEEQGAISGKYLCPAGSVLYSKIRPELRKAAMFAGECLCSADMYAIDPGQEFDRRFVFNFLLTDAFTSYAVLESLRVAMPKVNRAALGAIPLPQPNLAEQVEIAAYCAQVRADIGAIEDRIIQSVAQLDEYRSALITAAVTGRINIPADSQSDRTKKQLVKLAAEVA